MARNKKNPTGWLVVAAISLLALLVGGIVLGISRSGRVSTTAPSRAEPQETMAPNERSVDAFYTDDGFLRYADAPHLVGIDVSVHQGVIDWQAVAEAGVEFAIIRAGYRGSTEGRLYEDEQFRENLQGARAAGLKVGVYFFSQALNTSEAEDEAAYVCELLDGEALDLPVFFDWEEVDGSTHVPSLQDVPLTDCAVTFCEAVERHGYRAGVYFNQNFGYGVLELTRLQEYTLWLAEYGETPSFAYRFDCLQYSDSGSVAGITGAVDLDLLFLPEA